MPGFLTGMEVSASGLSAQRTRLNTVSSNLANAQTTRTAQGGPYRRLRPVFETAPAERGAFANALDSAVQSVRVSAIEQDPAPLPMVFDPGHPDADAQGYVQLPNVNLMEEMANMITASRSYEANATAFETLKSMARRALEIG